MRQKLMKNYSYNKAHSNYQCNKNKNLFMLIRSYSFIWSLLEVIQALRLNHKFMQQGFQQLSM